MLWLKVTIYQLPRYMNIFRRHLLSVILRFTIYNYTIWYLPTVTDNIESYNYFN